MVNRALLVGVSHYERNSLRELKAPLSDVLRLKTCLEVNQDFEVKVLIDSQKADIERSARTLLRGSMPSDRILFYYSGHGLRDFASGHLWLTTSSIDPEDPWNGGIKSTDLREWAREGKAGQLVMIFDCCFAAAAVEGRGSDGQGAVVGKSDFEPQRSGGGTHILMASDRDHVALTGEVQPSDGRASHFTDLIVRGLEGDAAPGESHITIRNLSDFLIKWGVEELGVQPVLSVDQAYGDFNLVQVPSPDQTLISRRLRSGAQSQRLVERAGAATLLGRLLANPPTPRHALGAKQLLEIIRDAADSDDVIKEIAREGLASGFSSSRPTNAEATINYEKSVESQYLLAQQATQLDAAEVEISTLRREIDELRRSQPDASTANSGGVNDFEPGFSDSYHGYYSKKVATKYVGSYFCHRWSYDDPANIVRTLFKIDWCEDNRCMRFHEIQNYVNKEGKNIDFSQEGEVFTNDETGLIQLLTVDSGRVRLITLTKSPTNFMRGAVLTQSHKTFYQQPAVSPVIFIKATGTEANVDQNWIGEIEPTDLEHSKISQQLRETEREVVFSTFSRNHEGRRKEDLLVRRPPGDLAV